MVSKDAIELYLNGGVYVLNEDNYAKLPEKQLQFIDNHNLGFQVSVSEFTVN